MTQTQTQNTAKPFAAMEKKVVEAQAAGKAHDAAAPAQQAATAAPLPQQADAAKSDKV